MKGQTNAQNGMTKIVGPTKADLESIPDGTFWRMRYKDSTREFIIEGYGTPIVPYSSYRPICGAYGGIRKTGYSESAWPVCQAHQSSDTTVFTIVLMSSGEASVKYTDMAQYATLYLYGGGSMS